MSTLTQFILENSSPHRTAKKGYIIAKTEAIGPLTD